MPDRERAPNEVSAGGVVVRPAGDSWEVCLIHSAGYWGFPKGLLETGETPAQAAVREISEEVGLAPEQLNLIAELPASNYVYRRQGRLIFKRVHHFLILAPPDASIQADPVEVQEARWVALADAPKLVTFDDARSLLAHADDQLQALTSSPR